MRIRANYTVGEEGGKYRDFFHYANPGYKQTSEIKVTSKHRSFDLTTDKSRVSSNIADCSMLNLIDMEYSNSNSKDTTKAAM